MSAELKNARPWIQNNTALNSFPGCFKEKEETICGFCHILYKIATKPLHHEILMHIYYFKCTETALNVVLANVQSQVSSCG